ncbi:hypothetical protein chiPu_0031579, partial [Chiloscyllium punctatum]|nr:hypothetical protein [Chiloscyllium punctatum]
LRVLIKAGLGWGNVVAGLWRCPERRWVAITMAVLTERERCGLREILHSLGHCELFSVADTVTNRMLKIDGVRGGPRRPD